MHFTELENVSPGNYMYDVGDQLKRHVYERSMDAFKTGELARDAIRTPAQLEVRQKVINDFFVRSLNGLPTIDIPLMPQKVGELQCNGVRIEKIVFEGRWGQPEHYEGKPSPRLFPPPLIQKYQDFVSNRPAALPPAALNCITDS